MNLDSAVRWCGFALGVGLGSVPVVRFHAGLVGLHSSEVVTYAVVLHGTGLLGAVIGTALFLSSRFRNVGRRLLQVTGMFVAGVFTIWILALVFDALR